MAYVVDLIVIMRAVFQASCEDKDGTIQRHRVEEIIDKYNESERKREIHDTIRGFVQHQFPCKRSTVVGKIEALIKEDRDFTQESRAENEGPVPKKPVDTKLPVFVFDPFDPFQSNPQAE